MVPNDSYTRNTRKVVTDLTNRIGENFLTLRSRRLRQRFLAENGVWNRFESQCAIALSKKYCQKNVGLRKIFRISHSLTTVTGPLFGFEIEKSEIFGSSEMFFWVGFFNRRPKKWSQLICIFWTHEKSLPS